MKALVAALGCGVMMIVALGPLAWYAKRTRKLRGRSSEASALAAELAALRRGESGPSGDEPSGRP